MNDILIVKPTVSVFMMTYQHAPYIRQALDSVLMQQTNFPIEICIGEDESTDGTREICQGYARMYPDRIRLFLRSQSEPLRKIYRSPAMFNQIETLRACRGRYIAILEGDDYWTDPLKLQKQVDYLESYPECTGVFHDTWMLNESMGGNRELTLISDPRDQIEFCDLLTVKILFHTSSFIFRRGVLPTTFPKWVSKVASGDIPIFLFAAAKGHLFHIRENMSVYRLHRGGITNTFKHRGANNFLYKSLIWMGATFSFPKFKRALKNAHKDCLEVWLKEFMLIKDRKTQREMLKTIFAHTLQTRSVESANVFIKNFMHYLWHPINS